MRRNFSNLTAIVFTLIISIVGARNSAALDRGQNEIPLPPGTETWNTTLTNNTGKVINDFVISVVSPGSPQIGLKPNFAVNDTAVPPAPVSFSVEPAAPNKNLYRVVIDSTFIWNPGVTISLDGELTEMVPVVLGYKLVLGPTFQRRLLLEDKTVNNINQTEFSIPVPIGGNSGELLFFNQTDQVIEAVTLFLPEGAILDPSSVYGGQFPTAEVSWGSVRFSGAEIQPGQQFEFGAEWDLVSDGDDTVTAKVEYKKKPSPPKPETDVVGLVILGVIILLLVGYLSAAFLALLGRTRAALVVVIASTTGAVIVLSAIFLLSYLELIEPVI
ncbi:MAG: hypothetical protein NUW37_13885 [Planctomycetes bacterium]|nr:hypothetical protein [Planctomycetota bacterium]